MFKIVKKSEWEDLMSEINILKCNTKVLHNLWLEQREALQKPHNPVRISPRTGKPVRKYRKRK